MNDFKCTGRITRELEMKQISDGTPVINFSIAIARENNQGADFVNATAFGKTATLINTYTGKGLNTLFMGKMCSDSYEKDGKTVYTNYMLVQKVEFIEYKNGKKTVEPATVPTDINDEITIASDDLPF